MTARAPIAPVDTLDARRMLHRLNAQCVECGETITDLSAAVAVARLPHARLAHRVHCYVRAVQRMNPFLSIQRARKGAEA